MEMPHTNKIGDTIKTLAFLASSFMLAFCIQVTVHELGHLITGLIAGARDGKVFLHPFYNSRVIFGTDPGSAGMVFTGAMGIGLDMILSISAAIIAWKKKSPLALPFLLWTAIAFIGEGIGMIGSLSLYSSTPNGHIYEDITQLMRIGVSETPIWILSGVFVAIGSVLMILVTTAAGLSPDDSVPRRFAVYACGLPLYFALAILYIKAFNPDDGIIEVRTMQAIISCILAVIFTALHKSVHSLVKHVIKTRTVTQPQARHIITVFVLAAAAFGSLVTYSRLFN